MPQKILKTEKSKFTLGHFTADEFGLLDLRNRPSDYLCNLRVANPQYWFIIVPTLEMLRAYLETPITITSGVRSIQHNKDVGGVPTSDHLKALAADIKFANFDALKFEAIKFLISLPTVRKVHLYSTFLHVSFDPTVKLDYDLPF